MEDQQPAGSPAPERAPEPATSSFESQEPAGSEAPARAYADEPGAAPESPAQGSSERGQRGYGRGFRDRGRGGRGGRRPLPRRRSGGGFEPDRPAGDLPPEDDLREDRPADFDRSPADEEHEAPVRSYEDDPPRDRVREPEPDRDEPRRDYDREDDYAAEGEGSPDDEPPVRSESGEGYERPRRPEAPRRERERPPRDRGGFGRRERGGERGRFDRDRDRDRGGDRDRDRDRGGDRDRDRDRGRDRGGDRGGDRGRERSIYMELRSQVDRIRHTLETVQRDLERVLQTIVQAEQEQRLSEDELESLKAQLSGLNRGGGYRERDRDRGGERERPREGGYSRPPEDHHD